MADNYFIDHEEVRAVLADAGRAIVGKRFSDLEDDEGHQYVDVVMEGGGVLGIALLGYLYVLEECGIRFLNIGGTSAGSITATMLAACAEKQYSKTKTLLDVLANKDISEFMDGGQNAIDVVDAWREDRALAVKIWKLAQVIGPMTKHYGLHPGDKFREWIESELMKFGITNTRELNGRIDSPIDTLRHVEGKGFDKKCRLALVTAEVTTESKIEFPRMAGLFWPQPGEVNPAEYVRASMSIPLFFRPYVVENIPDGPAARKRWDDLVSFGDKDPNRTRLPKKCYFMDGGIVSNFPIQIFHVEGVPDCPTFGVKLGIDRVEPHPINKLTDLIHRIFDTARHALDYDFIIQNPDYEQLVARIDTSDHDWLNFSLSESQKIDLFVRGAKAARDFLKGFEWGKYKEFRRGLAEARRRRSTPAITAGPVVEPE